MLLIKNAQIVNEDRIISSDVLIKNGRIEKIAAQINSGITGAREIDATGLHLFPGCIDDQVHFREPGLTHKGTIQSESRAAVAGGITSFMEMPNTVPQALTHELLEQKYAIAAKVSPANYSFFMGTSNHNVEEVLKTDLSKVCGLKIFMGSSTGDMLVDNHQVLEKIFSSFNGLIATHCEDEQTIKNNLAVYKERYGNNIPVSAHPEIRNVEACYLSSSYAVSLARKHGTRLHVLHISTGKETHLFDNDIPLNKKRITSEACIHHLWFCDEDYQQLGNHIKWNPAIKTAADREGIWKALLDGRIDVIATDHAPHTLEEKSKPYTEAPSGGPLVQHTLIAMIEFYKQGKISLENIARKMAHDVAVCFKLKERGYIREGYYADLVLADLNKPTIVEKSNLLYHCGWSPFEGVTFGSSIHTTIVNGNVVYENGKVLDEKKGMRLEFEKER
jgi:dihydroorotase